MAKVEINLSDVMSCLVLPLAWATIGVLTVHMKSFPIQFLELSLELPLLMMECSVSVKAYILTGTLLEQPAMDRNERSQLLCCPSK